MALGHVARFIRGAWLPERPLGGSVGLVYFRDDPAEHPSMTPECSQHCRIMGGRSTRNVRRSRGVRWCGA